MTKIIISLGSNVCQEQHMQQARGFLTEAFPGIVFSPVLWTSPVDMPCAGMFQNGLAVADTHLACDEVQRNLKETECLCGRCPEDKERGIVAMDIDLLLYGKVRLHEKDWKRPYIVRLMEIMDL